MEEMYIAHLATSNYDFYLVADSEEIMWQQLEISWNNHRANTGATWSWEEIKDSVWWNKQHTNLVWRKG